MLSAFAADVIGICGSVIFIGAFIYANITPAIDKVLFNILNMIGAVLLLVSLSVHFNLAAFVLEAAWLTIAIFGLVAALRAPK